MKLNQLEREFVIDHRKATQALKALISAVSSSDEAEVRNCAKQLDQIAGPHIAFEEGCLYPLVGMSRGKEYETHLRNEHHEVVDTLTQIRHVDWATVTAELKAEWLKHLQVGMDHIVTCGTLLSHLTGQSSEVNEELLNRLQALRNERLLWTELDKRS